MTVSQILDPAREALQRAFSARAVPEDEFEWEISIVPAFNECEEHGGLETAVMFFARLRCPESQSMTVVSSVMPMEVWDDQKPEEWADTMWDKMSAKRLMSSIEDHEPDSA